MTHVHVYLCVSRVSVLSVSLQGGGGHEIKRQKGTGGGRMGCRVQEVGGCDHPVPLHYK